MYNVRCLICIALVCFVCWGLIACVCCSFTVLLHNALPFVGFGFLDNCIMIVAVSISFMQSWGRLQLAECGGVLSARSLISTGGSWAWRICCMCSRYCRKVWKELSREKWKIKFVWCHCTFPVFSLSLQGKLSHLCFSVFFSLCLFTSNTKLFKWK